MKPVKDKAGIWPFFSKRKSLQYKHGEIVIRAGDSPSGVYFIEKGFVKVYAIEQNGEENLHIVYKEGELFPLIWTFTDKVKDLYYQAVGKVILKRLSREEFIEFIKKTPDVSVELIKKLISIIDVHADRIENLEISRSYPRMIWRILFLSQRFGAQKGKQIVIEAPLTHHDIAMSINMTRETASRDFEALRKKGLIEYKNHLLVIKDLRKLKHELSLYYESKPL